jgi:hypothetical protein
LEGCRWKDKSVRVSQKKKKKKKRSFAMLSIQAAPPCIATVAGSVILAAGLVQPPAQG